MGGKLVNWTLNISTAMLQKTKQMAADKSVSKKETTSSCGILCKIKQSKKSSLC